MNVRISGGLSSIAALLAVLVIAGCQNLPGTREQQGAVAGGVAGALAGEAIGDGPIATLLGGALGAYGGYLVGGETDLLAGGEQNREEAIEAAEEAQRDPATAADVEPNDTADLDNDGYVTMDELLALEQAGLDNQEIIDRLQATEQVFILSPEQKDRLREAGLDQEVVAQLENINREQRDQLLSERGDVISRSAE